MNAQFDHEKLEVYQRSLVLSAWVGELLESLPKSSALWKQLDRASISIALNIAEGNGKYTPADRCRFFDIARGSALESAAALDLIVVREFVVKQRIQEGKEHLHAIVSMLTGLIKSTSRQRAYEDSAEYSTLVAQD